MLEISPESGWKPAWRDGCIIATVFGSLLITLALLRYLIVKERHLRLLNSMLPSKVIKHFQIEDTLFAESFEHVTVLFADIVDYTVIASSLSPLEVVTLLDDLYSKFDVLVRFRGVYKGPSIMHMRLYMHCIYILHLSFFLLTLFVVETIGDSYMCASGCPLAEDPEVAAHKMASLAEDMIRAVRTFQPACLGEGFKVEIRIGMHTGPIVAGPQSSAYTYICIHRDRERYTEYHSISSLA
jgi:class 3 adenylate cyclase